MTTPLRRAARLAATLALVTTVACAPDAENGGASVDVTATDGVASDSVQGLPAGVTAEALEQGREAFTVCVTCHGFEGEGTALGPSLRDTAWIHIDGSIAEIAAVIRTGVSEPAEYPVPMPVLGGGAFTEEELEALAAYVFALGQGAATGR